MSYRTYINDTQVFGNNECYEEWIEFVQSQGIEVDEDCNYKGEIKDFMKALEVVETIVMRLEKERRERRAQLEKEMNEKGLSEEEKEITRSHVYGIKSIFDWSHVYDDLEHEDKNDRFHTSLFDKLNDIVDNGYAFMPLSLYKACEDKLERDKCFSVNGHFDCFKLKEGETITVSAN
jgi:hypothetical protein